jgi:hypothetical protein
MPTQQDDKSLIKFFELRINRCRELAIISKEALVNPVDLRNASMDEFEKQDNRETGGEVSIAGLQKEFSRLKPLFIDLNYSNKVINHIEHQINEAKRHIDDDVARLKVSY